MHEEGGNDPRFDRGLLVSSRMPSDGRRWWKHDHRTGLWSTAAMNNWRIAEPLCETHARWKPISFPQINLKELRPDQERACDAWRRTRRGVIVMATGTGKTEVALHLVREVGSHTLFVAPTRALAYQLAERIESAFGIQVGFIGDHTYRLEPISVTTYQSAGIKMEHLGDYFKLIVFDECHHLPGDLVGEAARMSAAPYRLGLTATPRRADGRETNYETLIGPVCHEFSISEAREAVLAGYRIERIAVLLTNDEQTQYDRLGEVVRKHMSDRREDDPEYDWEKVSRNIGRDPEARHAFYARLKRVSIEEQATAKLDVLEDLFREHMQQVVVFTGSNVMARAVSTRFLIPCLLAHSKSSERNFVLRGYEEGRFKAIVANRVLNEGVDVPAAKVAIVVGGTGSEREAIQRLGRILRKKGVQAATLYEVVCAETGEEARSRKRRRNDAYQPRSAL